MPILFSIETSSVRVVWSRRRAKTPAVEPASQEVPFGLIATVPDGHPPPAVQIHDGEATHLLEQTDYTLFVQSLNGQPVAVRHRDPVVLQGLHQSDDGRVIHGTINFGSQVGRSRFLIDQAKQQALAFEVEVFPSKLDYESDYAALRDDVREIAAELVFEHLRATYDLAAHERPDAPGPLAWLALLQHVADDLERALAYMNQHPLWSTARTHTMQRVDRIRRPDAALRRAVRHGAGRGTPLVLSGMPALQEYLPAAAHHYTLDAPAHRWLAARLHAIQRRLALLHDETRQQRRTLRRQHALNELATLQRRVARLQQLPVIQEAEGPPPPEPPLSLLTAPGYREAYQACVHLQQGVHLSGGPLGLSLKDLHLLYEYWCFLTLVRLVAGHTGHQAALQSLIAVEPRGLRLRLRKGSAQTVRFPLPDGRLDITYNPRFGGRALLVPQQPDLLLIRRHRDGTRTRYILDAKYRLDASPGYRRRYGVPGPPPEALNTLHRYRDALRSTGAPVVQALALYPYHDDPPGAYVNSRLHHLLHTIGVGAIPLLPNTTHHLDAWLLRVMQHAT